ncbi:hypothetical protein CIPAW_13G001700 [Carya illinoinensis]|uniref:Uncharacterized protein n=1 Tax=Carya illinoinensis TaxID=32201 RepID=A0A8T1NMS2_CARIL|nr:hypothetical protein CIPAW_13G001700 [Carya illinoinensis]
MESSNGISEDGGSCYHPLLDSDSIVSNDVRLQQLGYKRELNCSLLYAYLSCSLYFFFLISVFLVLESRSGLSPDLQVKLLGIVDLVRAQMLEIVALETSFLLGPVEYRSENKGRSQCSS